MITIRPYYDADGITVYHAPFEDVIAAVVVDVMRVALIHDDPPYGVKERTARASAGRGRKPSNSKSLHGTGPRGMVARDFPAMAGDDEAFSAELLITLDRPTVIWGGHLCQPTLPRSTSWLFWGKRAGTTPDDNGDGEMAWTNLGGPIREFQHLWRGSIRASEVGPAPHLHPTQKPIALCSWVYQRARLKRGDLVFVPHMGSGPDLPAASAAGLQIIACDVEEWCCRTAVARLGASPHPEPHAALGPLFANAWRAP